MLGAVLVGLVLTRPVPFIALSTQARDALVLAENTASGQGSWPLVLPQRSVLTNARGNRLATMWTQNRVVRPSAGISPKLSAALIAVEDSRFYSHGAVDPRGVVRAGWTDLLHGSAAQGGSTLTQEYAKNLMLQVAMNNGDVAAQGAATAKDLGRKVDELELAQQLEAHLSKDQILAGYLNTVYFGHGAYGAQAAAQAYFARSAENLSLDQAALLAGIVQQPTAMDPYAHPQAATTRRNEVLDLMLRNGVITAAQAATARRAPIRLATSTPDQGCAAGPEPYFCDWAWRRLASDPRLGPTPDARSGMLAAGGLTITTTLEPTMQNRARTAVTAKVPTGDPSGVRAAVAVVQPGTGHVLAMAQDTRYGFGAGRTTMNYAVDQTDGGSQGFPAGSTFKAFTLAEALRQGMSPSTVIDAPASRARWSAQDFTGCGPVDVRGWRPTNAPGDPWGPMDLTTATALSVDTAYVALEGRVGICAVRRLAEQVGVHPAATGQHLADVPSFTLGPFPVSPLTMASAYATFAADGIYAPPTAILAISHGGQPLPAPHHSAATNPRQVLDPSVAHSVTEVLRQVVLHGTGTRADPGFLVAGKTGTTDANTATWFDGYTHDLAAAVWVGDPTGTTHPMQNIVVNNHYYRHVDGGTLAAPIFRHLATG
ncbi:transglycosylase domain-containing protein [Arsenicicoccus bolidensis]|uniref:Transglycosylase domain-containing protein n=1 Tax=Arsenicicoccus bolidensis TaxID=229480 RepID=A0ABS9Q6Q8_9MICO|nr:transglycosylase domain-containing protein [Arsenicicoccus bolidensis]MCG7323561.1 transglycosylase domain-containing protein [Arsenicicoccus bolidensis]